MKPMRRALVAILLMTAGATVLMRAQATAMADLADAQELRVARATAMTLASEELAQAGATVRAGRPVSSQRMVDTPQGRMRIATETERQAERLLVLRVSVADERGRVLSTYETVLDTEVR